MSEDEPLLALGYLRGDLSGEAQQWDAKRLRALATRYGYRMDLIVTHTASTPNRTAELLDLVRRMDVAAVFLPALEHLPVSTVRALLGEVDGVTTLYPQQTFQRHATAADVECPPRRPF
ncbi:hypothetical protein [Nocardia callitridis]|uniref:Resolvase/invertase-type recombinase catalytic domain-containing protein n=1 Tax=Nocardia callitridis TaxID=648753 RepID=A0ABP9K929_9NOCA